MPKLTKNLLLLVLIVFLGAFLRFYRLSDFPVHLNHDEISQLYDAISIAQTEKDAYGNFLPVIFPSTQDFKPPLYTYMTSLVYLLFGGGELTIRLPGAFFGSLIIPAIYLFVLKLLKQRKIALIAAFFTAIAPFEIFFSRKSFENEVGILLMLVGFTSLLNYLEVKKKKWLYVGVIILGFALYTYFSQAILIPLLLITFLLIFKNKIGSKRIFFTATVLFFAISLPLFIVILTNEGARYRSQTVFITQDINLGRLIQIENKYKAILDFSFNRYLDQFNIEFLFGSGLDLTNQGPLGIGPLLFIQLPFLLLGIFYLVSLSGFTEQKKFMLAWVVLGMLPSGLTFEAHSPHRSVMVFTMLNIISAVGMYYFIDLSTKKIEIKIIMSVLIIAFALNVLYFIHIYFVNFPFEKSQYLHYPFKQVALFAWSQHDNFDQIIFDPKFGETAPEIGNAAHYYLAYYGNYPPATFQKEYRIGQKPREVLFDKFSIREIDWRKDRDLKKVLIIGSDWSLPINTIDKKKIIKTFYFYDKQPAFYAIGL